jgi:prepilin-type processing-associated H-X9-DG protein/prepilin-type N-terminal cleavage/methylation domain-containing protein
MRRNPPRAFTLVELTVVVGLISMLVALTLPVLGKMRAAAQSTVCASNLRVIGQAWTMYLTESRGKLPVFVWQTPSAPDSSWNGYWLGLVERKGGVEGNSLLCPTASAVAQNPATQGYGNATTAWTGRFTASGTGINFNGSTWRQGSYGYNRYLSAGGGFGRDGSATSIGAIPDLAVVPLAFDCAFPDVRPANGDERTPVDPPPDLQGSTLRRGQPEHWNFLLARHARGVNVCLADGHVKWVQLEELYRMTWKSGWNQYRLRLPMK